MFSRKKVFMSLVSIIAIAIFLMVGATSVLAADKIVWKSSGHGPATDPSQIYHDKCCQAITEASGGRLTIKPFVGGSVVPAYKELDAVHEGVLQMCYTCPMYQLDKWSCAGLISSRPGGLHLVGASQERIDFTIAELKKWNPELILPLHCSGREAMCQLKSYFPEKTKLLNCGDSFSFNIK